MPTENGQLLWQDQGIQIVEFSGAHARQYFDDMARLRIEIFYEFPYLYFGSIDVEIQYLETYLRSETSRVALVFYEGRVCGMATHLPLSLGAPFMQEAFEVSGHNVQEYYYIGDILFEKGYRKHGMGSFLMNHCAQRAQQLGHTWCLGMTIQRSSDHPLWPMGYISFDTFMHKQGYALMEDVSLEMEWQRVPDGKMANHMLQFWRKAV